MKRLRKADCRGKYNRLPEIFLNIMLVFITDDVFGDSLKVKPFNGY